MDAPKIEFRRRLRWADADAAGRLHFPRIFEIVEEAEGELMRAADWPFDARRREYDFPRVHVESRFLRILDLDAPFRLLLTIGRLGRTSIRYDYRVFDAAEELAIEGTMTVVVLKDGRPVEIPPPLRAALGGGATPKDEGRS
ncbi:MAG TPA: thioesterase family protein [Pyrinomonadaceae bacterium]|jgi:acyl-CoA thioesterase FadM